MRFKSDAQREAVMARLRYPNKMISTGYRGHATSRRIRNIGIGVMGAGAVGASIQRGAAFVKTGGQATFASPTVSHVVRGLYRKGVQSTINAASLLHGALGQAPLTQHAGTGKILKDVFTTGYQLPRNIGKRVIGATRGPMAQKIAEKVMYAGTKAKLLQRSGYAGRIGLGIAGVGLAGMAASNLAIKYGYRSHKKVRGLSRYI